MTIILYNPKSGNGHGADRVEEIAEKLGEPCEKVSYVGLDMPGFLSERTREDKVILVGGDGTLNRLANDLGGAEPPCDFYLIPAGTGNDFLRDIVEGTPEEPVLINPYLVNLPTVTINGVTRYYVNGIGFGLDGTACEVADEMIRKGEKNINYTSISIKLLLFGYHCPSATVTVDGVTKTYKKVWFASAMNGRYYGGGMQAAPGQERLSDKATCFVWHDSGRLSTLMNFASIFKGEHVKQTEMVDFMAGHEITVKFSRPNALQIDDETVLNVTEYTVRKGK